VHDCIFIATSLVFSADCTPEAVVHKLWSGSRDSGQIRTIDDDGIVFHMKNLSSFNWDEYRSFL
jgi:hypothetical protein